MKKLRSHFRFSKGQRNGIFLLISIILILQLTIIVVNNFPQNNESSMVEMDYQSQIDSLKQIATSNNNIQLFPFNPNFITDYKGYTLGMSNEEIDRLLTYRKQGQWINSSEQFQNITKISDSLLNVISPFFKFPNWIEQPSLYNSKKTFNNEPKSNDQKLDLNTATAEQLMKVDGIGEVLSDRIIKYRSNLESGFISEIQLQDVFGLKPDVIDNIMLHFTVKTPAKVIKLNLNSADSDQLVLIDYIDYEIAYNIIEYRTLNNGFKSLDELKKVKGFPIQRLDLIKLYLQL